MKRGGEWKGGESGRRRVKGGGKWKEESEEEVVEGGE